MGSGRFEVGSTLPPELASASAPCWSFNPGELTPRASWRQLGEGSFGCVYLAHWLGREVAVKVNSSKKSNRYEGIFRDIRYLSDNPHPNVVQIFGAFQMRSELCVVMEYMRHSLRDKRVVNKVDLVAVLADVARALVRLHSCGHIHRDVKARNVLISADFRVAKLADFGLARPLVRSRARPAAAADANGHVPLTDDDNKDDSESRRAVGMTPRVGPRKYRAPEVEEGLPYGLPCDMYSYGVMVRELLAVLKRRVAHRYGVTVAFLRALSLLCTRRNPDGRPSALEVLALLQQHMHEPLPAGMGATARVTPGGVLHDRLFGEDRDGREHHVYDHKRRRESGDSGDHHHKRRARTRSRERSRSWTGTSDAVLHLASQHGGPPPLDESQTSSSSSSSSSER